MRPDVILRSDVDVLKTKQLLNFRNLFFTFPSFVAPVKHYHMGGEKSRFIPVRLLPASL